MSPALAQSTSSAGAEPLREAARPSAASRPSASGAPRSAGRVLSTGRWTAEEHEEFIKCLAIYGREWKKVSERITTRTAAQIRSHAQKYFKKIQSGNAGEPDGGEGARARAAPARASAPRRRGGAAARPAAAPAPGEALRLARKRAAEEPAAGADPKLLRRRVACEDLQGLEHRELIALEMLCSRSSLSMRRADAEDRSSLSMRRADAEDRPPPLASC
ncbi:ubiquitin modification-dependent histone binding protein [Aureococcus anophagefferens]|uniref:Ubiquitin modification-dependent histone binding protein n=1 Tax=Aureococcus anophagefferens TaxID=44056 RepID=A0ABR1FS03_AURAN